MKKMSYFGWLKNTMFPNKSAIVIYIDLEIRSTVLLKNIYMYIPYKYVRDSNLYLYKYICIYNYIISMKSPWLFPW